MTNEMKSNRHWELHEDQIFSNQVSFGIEAYGSITLKMFPTHLEVFLNSEEGLNERESRVTCEEAYAQVKSSMKAIAKDYIKCTPFYGFYCNHVCPHPAKINWQKEDLSRSTLECTHERLKERCLVPKGYDMWNIKGKRQGIL